MNGTTGRWLLLFHQIPPKPDYFRVKVWRRLQRIGAVPVKNSVWVLPYNDQAVEDFRWLLEEIEAGGGEGSVCRGDFVDGLSDRDVEGLFHKARAADYAAIARAAKSLARKVAPIDVARLDHRLAEVAAIETNKVTGWISIDDAATWLGMGRRFVEELVAKQDVVVKKFGTRTRILFSSLQDWAARQPDWEAR